jgi:colanic acid biosynthesis glycosyl transferase WcaI
MPRKGARILARLLAWSGFHLISILAAVTIIPRPQVILVPSPPLTMGLVAWLLARFYRVPYVYNVQEIYPDVAINLGAIHNKWLIRLLFRLERFVYSKARIITVIASQMRQRLLEKRVPDAKIRVIPNFVDVEEFQPLPKANAFSQEHDIQDKFVVSYSGNMGPAQGLETFIEAADLIRNEPAIHFMMMGSGTLKERFERRVTDLGLKNFTFLPYQHISLMPQIYAASNLCLVPQTANIGSDAVPSKVYRIMAAARPVLACTDPDSDLAELVHRADCGLVVQPGSASLLVEAIQYAFRNPELGKRLGESGRGHVVENYARSVITNRYDKLIRTVLNGNVKSPDAG